MYIRAGGAVAATDLPVFEAVTGSIVRPEEEDLFIFTVANAGVHVGETSGGSDIASFLA